MSSSSTRQRHLKRPHCFMCESVPSASSSSSAASTRQRRRRRRSGTIHEPTATSLPSSSTSTIFSSTMASAGSSSAASLSASLPSYATSSIQQQQQQRRRRFVTVLVPTPSPPSSSMATPPSVPSTPSTLPPSTTTSVAAGSSISSSLSILALASGPSMPPSLAPSAATPVNVPSEPSFRDPALAERYWKYDHQKVSLSNAVAAELAFAAAPAFVKRVLGRWEKPPWFWGQKNSVAWLTRITREDMEEEKSVCAICMEEYRELQPCYILLRCFHFFHKYCLLQWGVHCFVQGKEMNCPLCRSIIPISPISLLHAA